ncbi:MAG: ComEC/Rec2 family competence protein [Ferruginibacter sp.]
MLLAICCFGTCFLLFRFLPLRAKYRLRFARTVMLHFVIISIALLLTWQKDFRNNKNWYGYYLTDTSNLVIQIDEPIAEKKSSYKTTATVLFVLNNKKYIAVTGKLLLYFSKDSNFVAPLYGDRILINNKLQQIKNSGNPGAFNYERYAAFQGYFQQAYLKNTGWLFISHRNGNILYDFIFKTKEKVINILRNYVKGKDELGIAEALLIGYKEDLDIDLVQAYSNTGVVHIIAISGMHLALIYFLLLWTFNHIPWLRRKEIIKAILTIAFLWLFSLLTGAAASVLRSAVMFSFLSLGKLFFRSASIYNTLAVSAFVLLVYNPYLLWDVGFQLSYLAVIGIVALQKPLFRLWYIPNKIARKLWELLSISIAAQLATFPLCLYYFHQFPNLFFITNLFAVPLSTALVYIELLLIVFYFIHPVALLIGKLLSATIWLMNYLIRFFNSFSFSVWDNIYTSVFATCLFYFMLLFMALWLVQKKRSMLRYMMLSILMLTIFYVSANWFSSRQKKLVIYNVPRHTAIDLVYGNKYYFIGDSVLKEDGLLRNFHLKPSRTLQQATELFIDTTIIRHKKYLWQFLNKKIMIIDSAASFETLNSKLKVDILLLSHNSKTKITNLVTAIQPSIIVFDASNSLWKIENWKKECEQLALRFHSVPEQGAFILDIN